MPILQKFGFKDSPYERPQDKWVCGHMAEGEPCLHGPAADGSCPAKADCEPHLEKEWVCGRLADGNACKQGPGADGSCRDKKSCKPHLKSERWQCRRSDLAGGHCETGPLANGTCCQKPEPCVPKPSLRTVRKRIAVWASVLCVGLLALILGGQNASKFLMPGPLSSQHASVADCKSCHAGVEPENLGWLHTFAAAANPQDNAKLCISCHDAGVDEFSPHTNPVDELRKLTALYDAGDASRPVKRDSWLQRIALPAANMAAAPGLSKIFCATCHEEHQGTRQDLKSMSNDRCQSCHTSKFGSFAASHPEFTSYPAARRARIIFDHKLHYDKPFSKPGKIAGTDQMAPSNCTDCHRLDAGRKYMEVKKYKSMCASCHDGWIVGTPLDTGPKGLEFLAVPGLDVAALARGGVDIGEWPEESEADLTGFLKALLATEPGGADVVSGVSQIDLQDLTDASGKELGSVKALAWAVKKLLGRMESTPLSRAMMKLPDNRGGAKIDRLQMALFTGLMPRDVIMMGNQEWFPKLKDDLERYAKGEPTECFTAPLDTKNCASGQPQPSEPQQLQPEPAKAEGQITPQSDDDILGGQDGNLEGSDILSGQDGNLEGSDILGGQDGNLEGSDILGGLDDAAKGDPLMAADETSPPEGSDGQAKAGGEPARQFNPESWAEFGGWYRQGFIMLYRPYGHSDRILRTWLDYSGLAIGTGRETLLKPVFDQLSGNKAAGRCTQCHSIGSEGAARYVNWRPYGPGDAKNRFTEFSHEPHIGASGNESCARCHQPLTSNADIMKTNAGGDAGKFKPSFKTIKKAVCSDCHTQKIAGETCVQCHNYHSRKVTRRMFKTRMP